MSEPQQLPQEKARARAQARAQREAQGGPNLPDAPALRNLAFLATGLTVAAVVLAVPALRDQAAAPAPGPAPVTLAQASPAPIAANPTPTAANPPPAAVQSAAPAPLPAKAAPPPVRTPVHAPSPAPPPLPLAPPLQAPIQAAQAAPAAAAPQAQAQPLPQPASCNINARSLISPFGQGVVTAVEDPLVSSRRIHGIEVATGGNIDPNYATTLRVVVQQVDGTARLSPALPPGLVVHVGDRVMITSGYRNMNLPCNYVPPHVTTDLGPAAPAPGAARPNP